VAVLVVDALEMVDIEHDRGQRGARARLGAGFDAVLEEGAAIEQAGQRIGGGEPDELPLHARQALRAAQSRIELLRRRRLANEIVGAAVERLNQMLLIVVRGHDDDVNGAAPARQQPRFPAQLRAGN
jgi:hypothetical protein